jgi:hypothetical protein
MSAAALQRRKQVALWSAVAFGGGILALWWLWRSRNNENRERNCIDVVLFACPESFAFRFAGRPQEHMWASVGPTIIERQLSCGSVLRVWHLSSSVPVSTWPRWARDAHTIVVSADVDAAELLESVRGTDTVPIVLDRHANDVDTSALREHVVG